MNIQMVCMVCGSASVEVSGYMATISPAAMQTHMRCLDCREKFSAVLFVGDGSAHIEFIKCK